jgi:tRNA(Arg) A34 adenosine deaminase TadA
MAKENDHDFKIAAVVFKGGSIIRGSINTEKFIGYRKNIFEFIPTRHAEIMCLHNMPKSKLEGCSMIVVRVNRANNGVLSAAKPCKACMTAIKSAGIKKVYYSDYDGTIKKITPSKVDLNAWEKDMPCEDYIRENTPQKKG